MRGLWRRLAELSLGWRWGGLAGGGILLGAALAGVVWYALAARQQAGLEAFARPAALYRQALAEPPATPPGEAVKALREFIVAHPRHPVTPQAWYDLGNLLYRTGTYDEAREAFAHAAQQGKGDLVALSRLGLGYAWEGKGDYTRALEAYRDGGKTLRPGEFLYGEFLLGIARSQERLRQREDAVKTYRQFLKDLPQSIWADEVKARLARLGGSSPN